MKRLIGLVCLTAAIGFSWVMIGAEEDPSTEPPETGPMRVEYTEVRPGPARETINGYGLAGPRWETQLASAVEGTVLDVAERLQPGNTFQAGDILVTVDPTPYRTAVASARSALAAAQRLLREEEQRSAVAQDNWQATGLTNAPSDLALRKPQLAEAQANVAAAEAALRQALYDLSRTEITAPYDGMVRQRLINPGDYVQPGTVVAGLFDTSVFEVAVPLSNQEVARLTESAAEGIALLEARDTGQTWTGTVIRIDPVIDAANRRRNVIVEVPGGQGLVPGQFLSVEFFGQSYGDILQIPDRQFARDGYLWIIDAGNTLRRIKPVVAFSQEGISFVRWPSEIGPEQPDQGLRIVEYRDGYLSGVTVQSVPGDGTSLATGPVVEGDAE